MMGMAAPTPPVINEKIKVDFKEKDTTQHPFSVGSSKESSFREILSAIPVVGLICSLFGMDNW